MHLNAKGRAYLKGCSASWPRSTASPSNSARPPRRVRIVSVEAVAEKWLLPRLASFKAAHPGIATELETNHRSVVRYFRALDIDLRHGGDDACYVLRNDYIQMPPFGLVHDAEGYYSTLAHESVHWTRHESRLDRRFRSKSAQDSYAKEELVAEIGSAGPSSQLLKAGEDAGAAGHREPGDQERAAWLKHAHALVEEGRSLPQAWEAASVPSGDMAGALSGIRAATARIEAALLADERKAFGRLARSVNREVKETGVHFLDASAYRPLLESMQNLRKHDGLPDDTRALVAKWREADGRWKDACLSGCHPHPLYVWCGDKWLGRRTKRGWMFCSGKTFRLGLAYLA